MTTPTPLAAYCTLHPTARAGWRCTGCEKKLCPDCVGEKQVSSTSLTVCVHCQTSVEPLLIKRSEEKSFAARLPSALSYPFSRSGLLSLLGAGLVLNYLGIFGCIFWIVSQGILWGFVFTLARQSAFGSDEIEPPDFTTASDLISPVIRAGLAVVVSWAPAMLYLIFFVPSASDVLPLKGEPGAPPAIARPLHKDLKDANQAAAQRVQEDALDNPMGAAAAGGTVMTGGTAALLESDPAPVDFDVDPKAALESPRAKAVRGPIFALLVLLGFILGPMSLAIGVAGGEFREMLNPVKLVTSALRFPVSYAFFAGSLIVLACVEILVWLIAQAIGQIPVPILPGVLGSALVCVIPFVMARVMGLFLYVHGAELGYLEPQAAYAPALPGSVPRGVLPVAATPEVRPVEDRRNLAIEDDPAMAGVSGNAANWQAPSREVALPPALDGAADAPLFVRPKEISLDDDEPLQASAPEAQVRARPRPTALDPTASDHRAFDFLDEPSPEATAAPLVKALAAKDYAQALALYRTAEEAVKAQVDGDGLFELGRQAATEGRFPEAAQLLRSAAQVEPGSPTAPKALVILGRVVGERMGDVEGARKVFAHIVRSYPGTDAAKFAEARLKPSA